MSALSVIRGEAIGIAAVVVPSAGLGYATVSILAGGQSVRLWLGVTLVLVGGLAWDCVSVAHFPPGLAVFLTTLPFGVFTLLTLSELLRGNVGGFVLCFGQLLVAGFVARGGTRLVKR